MYSGIIAFGFNSDGYGDYNNGMAVEIVSYHTSDVDDTLELIKKIATDYCTTEVQSGWEMPYSWCWGDVFSDIPAEVFAGYGVTTIVMTFNAMFPHDETVVPEMSAE